MAHCEELWNKFIDYFDLNDYKLFLYGSFFYQIAIFWIVGSVFLYFDTTRRRTFMSKYKIQPTTNPIDENQVIMCVIQVKFNQIFVSFPVFCACSTIRKFIGSPNIRKLPSIQELIVGIIVAILIYEILYFYSHLALHSRYLYKSVHKRHHIWTSPIAISAYYAHPVEHIIHNLVPMMAGVILIRAHILTIFLFFTIATFYNLINHSGYHLPFLPSPEANFYHHLNSNEVFGNWNLFDSLHGTNKFYKTSDEYKRDTIILSLVPARILYPSISNNK